MAEVVKVRKEIKKLDLQELQARVKKNQRDHNNPFGYPMRGYMQRTGMDHCVKTEHILLGLTLASSYSTGIVVNFETYDFKGNCSIKRVTGPMIENSLQEGITVEAPLHEFTIPRNVTEEFWKQAYII